MLSLINRYSEFCKKYARPVFVFPLFIITQGLYLFIVLKSIPAVKEFSEGLELPELMPTGYSKDYLPKLFEVLGEQGREVYMNFQIPLDMIYPLLFGISYSLLLSYLFKKGVSDKNGLNPFVVVPVFASIFDYLENISIWWQLKSYPEDFSVLSGFSGVCTVLKSGFTSLFFVLLFVGIATMMIRRMKNSDILKGK